MKAIGVFSGEREIRILDHPAPELASPTEVELRVLDVGVCGTDREIASFTYGTPPRGCDYFVLGHEALGEVTAVGDRVSSLAPGDLAVPMVRRPCPHPWCLACREGRQDFCYSGDFTERGIQGAHGFMTERVVDEERFMVRVPAELRDVAVLVEPLSIAEKALIQVFEVQERLPWACRAARASGRAPQLRALVLGAGPVGLLGAMTLRGAGFETAVFSREPADGPRAELVRSIGARYHSARDTAAAELPRAIGLVDLVYEAVGASSVAFEVLQVLGANAIFVFTGVPGRKEPLSLDADALMRRLVLKNQVVFGTVNAGRDAYEAAVRDLGAFTGAWPAALQALITGGYRWTDYSRLLSGEIGGIKNVIEIESPTRW